jgi:hypothetical protein
VPRCGIGEAGESGTTATSGGGGEVVVVGAIVVVVVVVVEVVVVVLVEVVLVDVVVVLESLVGGGSLVSGRVAAALEAPTKRAPPTTDSATIRINIDRIGIKATGAAVSRRGDEFDLTLELIGMLSRQLQD